MVKLVTAIALLNASFWLIGSRLIFSSPRTALGTAAAAFVMTFVVMSVLVVGKEAK